MKESAGPGSCKRCKVTFGKAVALIAWCDLHKTYESFCFTCVPMSIGFPLMVRMEHISATAMGVN